MIDPHCAPAGVDAGIGLVVYYNLLVDSPVDPYDRSLLARRIDRVDRRLHRREVAAPVAVDAEGRRGVGVWRGESRGDVVTDGPVRVGGNLAVPTTTVAAKVLIGLQRLGRGDDFPHGGRREVASEADIDKPVEAPWVADDDLCGQKSYKDGREECCKGKPPEVHGDVEDRCGK